MEPERGRGEMALQSIHQIRTVSWADPACPASLPSEDTERNCLRMALWLPCRLQVPLLSWLPSSRLSHSPQNTTALRQEPQTAPRGEGRKLPPTP